MNIILYGIPADTAELIAGRYDLELIHSIEEIGTCGALLPVPKITAPRQLLALYNALMRHEDAIDAVNSIASEHLELVTRNPFEVMTKIRNAGAIFIGEYSSEPLGDYFAGPNHVLPTNGTAKFFSALSVDDFIKKSSIVYYSKEALEPIHEDIITFAEAEKLTAHANSIRVRFEK